MLSRRIGRVINEYRERIGLAFVAISVFWLMGVAGADDFNTMQHIFTPVFPLVIKSIFGLLGMGLGVMLVNMKGGEDDESDL